MPAAARHTGMSLAARTREAAREHPFLIAALGAGVVNYTAAARYLDVDGDPEAVATALRRYAEDLDGPTPASSDARVRMESGLAATDDGAEALLWVGDAAFAPTGGSLTGVVATGAVGPDALAAVLGRLSVEGVDVVAAGAADGHLAVVVPRRAGADAVRTVEAALEGTSTTA